MRSPPHPNAMALITRHAPGFSAALTTNQGIPSNIAATPAAAVRE
jgi:hypothetical protein